jgi:hypothetical protein
MMPLNHGTRCGCVNCFGLRIGSGKWSGERRGAFSESETERNVTTESQTGAVRYRVNAWFSVRDERGLLRSGTGAVERGMGRPVARETERKPALVTAGLQGATSGEIGNCLTHNRLK